MEKTIDARGQACPKPLVMARDTLKTLTQDDKLNVVVDNLVSAQNLEKMASQMNIPSAVSSRTPPRRSWSAIQR